MHLFNKSEECIIKCDGGIEKWQSIESLEERQAREKPC